MSRPCYGRWAGPLLMAGLIGCHREAATTVLPAGGNAPGAGANSFVGSKAGDEREVAGIRLCWCPAGQFLMGSPHSEPDRRPDEDQAEVTLTKGFWMAKYEVTQGQWKRIIGKLPGKPTAELPEGDDLPIGNVNFAEAEGFCRKQTELARASGDLPAGWEFRLPTEAQWEYACRAGKTTATAFGDRLSSKQANFQGKPRSQTLRCSGRSFFAGLTISMAATKCRRRLASKIRTSYSS
jgi:formylglycine-generating enzyme required for sulfatase activity